MSAPQGVTLPDTSTAEAVGPGMPIFVNQYGQSVYEVTPGDPTSVVVDRTSLAPGKYLLGLTLNRIFALLTKAVSSTQAAALNQSDRLQFLTAMQTAYTNKMASVHNFVSDNGDGFVDTFNNSEQSTERQDLTQTNSSFTSNMQAVQSIWADDAKSAQSTINQSNDAYQQDATMATSLIQQLSTILQSIYTSSSG